MTAPTYFVGDPDYTGFYLHHCVHYFDLVPHLMGAVSSRRHRAPGWLLLRRFPFRVRRHGTLVPARTSRAPPRWSGGR